MEKVVPYITFGLTGSMLHQYYRILDIIPPALSQTLINFAFMLIPFVCETILANTLQSLGNCESRMDIMAAPRLPGTPAFPAAAVASAAD